MSANPHANRGLLPRELQGPDFREYGGQVTASGAAQVQDTLVLSAFLSEELGLRWPRQRCSACGAWCLPQRPASSSCRAGSQVKMPAAGSTPCI